MTSGAGVACASSGARRLPGAAAYRRLGAHPAISTYLNERSPEAQRATVLSLETGLFSAIMIVLFPLFGFGLTRIDFGVAYRWTFVALLVGSGGARRMGDAVPRGYAESWSENGTPHISGWQLR